MKKITAAIAAKKRIALVAHDGMKDALVSWARAHSSTLTQHTLFGTGTTAQRIEKETGLGITGLLSGPLGGDQQIGAHIALGELDVLIFFWDPLAAQPHDPDVKALLRLAAVWNIPVACNPATADLLLSSPLFNQAISREIPDLAHYQNTRQVT